MDEKVEIRTSHKVIRTQRLGVPQLEQITGEHPQVA